MSRIDEIFDDYYTPMKLPDNNRSELKKKLLEAILECIGEDNNASYEDLIVKKPLAPRDLVLQAMEISNNKARRDAEDVIRIMIRNAIKDMFGEHIEMYLNLDSYIDKDTKNV